MEDGGTTLLSKGVLPSKFVIFFSFLSFFLSFFFEIGFLSVKNFPSRCLPASLSPPSLM